MRCILETAVQACDFQSESDRPTYEELIKEYDLLVKTPNGQEKTLSFMMRHNAWAAFLERYRVYEQTKRIAPSFRERVNRLKSREIFQEAPQFTDVLKRTYETLSDYVHPSSKKMERQLELRALLVPRFDSKEFDVIYALSLKTIDIVQFLYVKALSQFFGFEDAKEFLKALAKIVEFPSEIAASFLRLPFSKRLSGRITWRIMQEVRKPKSSKANKIN